ncbi:glycosyltransferase family 2 protein [Methylobacterium organophilum]|uniref:Glycosyltransferase 2-like domain-containing protein n=1 Tax=Methylobacterium organophilum TaxID=410 RepID=A0ABQ4T9G7_METOR|nr:glycosyltransferase [Methylobacterium organophilum]GJE27701.1 hypothetical protein LKMONMHP_2562 [Methylobacterium organophilum]
MSSDDAALDALAFLRRRPKRLKAWRGLLHHPRQTARIAGWWLSGKRLRARQALAALVGLDHRLTYLGPLPPEESQDALARLGIACLEPRNLSVGGDAPLILLTAPGHRPMSGAAEAIAAVFAADPGLHALYGDALFQEKEGEPIIPILRPAFDPIYLRQLDYVGPVLALRRASLEGVEAELVLGAEPLDLLLRLECLYGAHAIRHLPRFLSHWRPARGGEEGPRQARLSAVRRNLAEAGEGSSATLGRNGTIRILHPLPEPPPRVSLIVPTRDRLDLLRTCLDSLRGCTDWPDKEILICDNGSQAPETLAYFRALESEGAARILACPGPFDFAGMNNRAALQASGSVLAFVNNDVEAFAPDWLALMVREALRPEIGAVGAKLLDREGRMQHGGIVLGTGGLVTHAYRHFPGDTAGYLGALQVTHAVSAVTAACLVVEAKKFHAVGGFDAKRFAVDFNDVDLCLRLAAAGHHSLLVPEAVLHHREAASRRRDAASEVRHAAEIAALKERWGPLLVQDPHYHPGFDPGLSTHARLARGWTGLAPVPPR